MTQAGLLDEINQLEGASAGEGRQPAGEAQRILSRPDFTIRHTSCRTCEFQTHSHTAFTVTAVLAGSMAVTIGKHSYDMSQGQVAFTNTGQPHCASALEVEFVSVGISPNALSELVTKLGLTNTNAEMAFRENLAADEKIVALAREMASEMACESAGRDLMMDALVGQLMIHLLRTHLAVRKSARIEMSRAGPVDRRLRRAIEFMHDNYSRELALEEIASAAYLSEYHFARLFKQITGVTPHAYLANLRIERARKLLLETALAISEIASMVGYQSQSHFTKIFKAVTGVTPRAYRDSITAIER